jgi:predicted O-linked N-acetylglucosamine transferase (SPINDLY family)
VRFGSFNTTAKLSPEVLRTWVEILDRVPGSVLVLKASSLVDPRLREQVAARMAGWGLDPSRLEIMAPTPRPADHLALYAGVDIALDPFPYNGTTTTCEALWMGVPVVTVAGDRHCGRVGAALLRAAGLDELVAADLRAYVDLACEIASDRQRLGTLRLGLRDCLSRSALLDERAHTRRLEAALRGAWRAWCESPP